MMSPTSELDHLKRAAAQTAVALVNNGMIVGLGTGSTASFAVSIIAQRVSDGLNIIGIPTSEKIEQLARSMGIPISTLAEHDHIDISIDGADEVVWSSLSTIASSWIASASITPFPWKSCHSAGRQQRRDCGALERISPYDWDPMASHSLAMVVTTSWTVRLV